jgi:dihydroorotase
MPNTVPPVTTLAHALAYRQRIYAARGSDRGRGRGREPTPFDAYMTLYLTDATTPADIAEAAGAGAGAGGVVLAAKLYPHGVTTNSQYGVQSLAGLGSVFAAMQEHGIVLCIHGEVSSTEVDIFDREKDFVQTFLPGLVSRFPRLKVVLEHITTIEATEFVLSCGENVAATITPHHLLFNRSDLFKGGVRPHLFCLPILKRERHRLRLVEAATSGSPKFFLGSDSAPHAVDKKESSCGCAGVFSSHAALSLYAEAFDSVGRLDRLEDFCSTFGCRFYGLPKNTERVTLVNDPWLVPMTYAFGDGNVCPLRAGELVLWKQVEE